MFRAVKNGVKIEDAVRYYGVVLNRSNKGKCPFHDEKTASFSVNIEKQIFKCFGCGCSGDVISFVSNLLSISNNESCKKINDDFRLGINISKPTIRDLVTAQNKITIQKNKAEKEKKDFQAAVFMYKEYEKILNDSEPLSHAWCFAKNNIIIAEYRCLELIGVT
jgi:DNA primase